MFRLLFIQLILLFFFLFLHEPHCISGLTVHLISHSHDDVGWLQTVDQYYVHSVQYIFTSVVAALKRDSNRRFSITEQAYFQRWWRQQNEEMKNLTRSLVAAGQIEFVNGGWCMHDEATTHHIDMLDQTTLGHISIYEEFGPTANPRIGWQLDPFGHSSTQASLLTAALGFDALFFGRIDYQDFAIRQKDHRLEFIWRASPSLGDKAQIYTEVSWDGNVSFI